MISENNNESADRDPTPDLIRSVPTEIIGGVAVAAIGRQETARLLVDVALAARGTGAPPLIFSSANGQVLAELRHALNPAEATRLMGGAHVVSADGQPLVFASRSLGRGGVRERSATTDLFHDVARIAVTGDLSFFMLGATEEENARALERVRSIYPTLRIAGARHGYFASDEEEAAIVEWINSLRPDVVWVALGFPREQKFCERWRNSLTDVGVLKTSGGLFNFLSGSRARAPAWMQAAGLEWAWRLALEPRRLFVRYAVTNLQAAWLLLTRTGDRAAFLPERRKSRFD